MRRDQTKPFLTYLTLLLTGLFLAACAVLFPTPAPTPVPTLLPPSITPSLTATLSPTPSPSPSATAFPLPIFTPVTPIPPPITGLTVPEDVKIAILLGTDELAPYVARTDAMALVIYSEVTARASVFSLPADLFVYHPGYTMQRLNIAYAVGGFDQVASTIQYNFGVTPTLYALVHMNDFTNIVDELNGITVQTSQRVLELCGDNPAGRVEMDGQQAFCYSRVRFGPAEPDRNRRQLEIYAGLFYRLVRGGTLTRLPELYPAFENSIETNLTFNQAAAFVPLALKLGDTGRIEFFYLPDDDLTPWQLPDSDLPAVVLLPDSGEIRETVRKAIQFVLTPAPLSGMVQTLVAELTLTPTPTPTLTFTATNTRTATPYRSPVPSRTYTPTITNTPRDTRTPTATPTFPPTPTLTATSSPTSTLPSP